MNINEINLSERSTDELTTLLGRVAIRQTEHDRFADEIMYELSERDNENGLFENCGICGDGLEGALDIETGVCTACMEATG